METGKFSNNTRVTENGLVSGVDRVLKSSNSTFTKLFPGHDVNRQADGQKDRVIPIYPQTVCGGIMTGKF